MLAAAKAFLTTGFSDPISPNGGAYCLPTTYRNATSLVWEKFSGFWLMCVFSSVLKLFLDGLTPDAQPGHTLRSLTEAKTLLEQTRNELTEAKERAQIKPTHTFSPLPPSVFFPRPTEVKAIENVLLGQPSWTIVFGASSTGKVCFILDMNHISELTDPYLLPSMGDSRPRSYATYFLIPAIMYYISTFGLLVLPIWPVSTSVYG